MFYLCLLGLIAIAIGSSCGYYYMAASKAATIREAAIAELGKKHKDYIEKLKGEQEEHEDNLKNEHKLALTAAKQEAATMAAEKAQGKINDAYRQIVQLKEQLKKKGDNLRDTTEEMIRAKQELASLKMSRQPIVKAPSAKKQTVGQKKR